MTTPENGSPRPSGPDMNVLANLDDPYETLRWAKTRYDQKEYAKAAEMLARLDAEHPRSTEVRELLARSYYHSAQLGRAIATAEELLEDDPTNAYAAVLLTRALERSSRHEEAARMRRRAEALGGQF